MKAPSLYGPLARLLMIQQQIEDNDGELTPELEQAFSVNSENVGERSESMLEIRFSAQMLMAESEKRIAHEQAVIGAQKKLIERLDKGLKSAVDLVGPIQAGTYKLSLRKSSGVVISDEALIPDECRKPVKLAPEKGEPDKALIKKKIDAGEFVPGAFVENRSNIQIK